MDYQFDRIGNALKISLDGHLVASNAEDLKEAVFARMNECPNVLFDLSRMQYIDSSGLGTLVHVLQKASDAGGTVRLACLQPCPRIVFDITRICRIFTIFESVEAGLASFFDESAGQKTGMQTSRRAGIQSPNASGE